jgi:hypothetical protein
MNYKIYIICRKIKRFIKVIKSSEYLFRPVDFVKFMVPYLNHILVKYRGDICLINLNTYKMEKLICQESEAKSYGKYIIN